MEFEMNEISKEDFLKIKEEDIMFITNPGRMGDEDGLTFIIKKDKEFKIYRINGFLYPRKVTDESKRITFEETKKQFPIWAEGLKKGYTKNFKEKYKYIYMGFGNGLTINNSIYDKFKPYLDKEVEEYLKDEEDKEGLQYAAMYNTWEDAFIDMIEDNNTN